VAPPANEATPGRRLRVGYVSPDFRTHAARFFIEPVLQGHDRGAVEVYAYAEVSSPDEVTRRLQGQVDVWRQTAGLSDEALFERIRDDGIDVLVDLAGHTAGNRLLVFARRAAPVQVSWLGYGYTTGLEEMDYFLADEHFVPPDQAHLFSESIYRLGRVPFCYRPPAQAPEVGPLPARRRGQISFGCLSRPVRLNDGVIALWARLLKAVPDSRLVLNNRPFGDQETRELFIERFAAHGIGAERLELGYDSPPWGVYNEIDIALDPFPHNGGTTTFEALWMGLPVVSLAARASVGRFGATLLNGVGLGDWVAEDGEGYLARAVAAARDLEGLERLRGELRGRLRASPLLDEAGFVAALEGAYRQMWQSWCHRTVPAVADPAGTLQSRRLVAQALKQAVGHHYGGRLAEAEVLYREILRLEPDNGDALHLLGLILWQRYRHHDLSARLIERAIAVKPQVAEYHCNLATVLQDLGDGARAQTAFQRALELNPDYPVALNNLGNLLCDQGRFAAAEVSLRRAIALSPDYADAYSNLGRVLKDCLRQQEARDCYRRALEIAEGHVAAHTNLLFCLNYAPDLSGEAIYEEYQRWNERHAQGLSQGVAPPANEVTPGRRLRVGYVSPDFRTHAARFFIEPVLQG
ncbi:MAG: tetratricopeptide repeat protein, partial [Candidatus Competibacteraceae bacterium]|nr:tetratricopeptide repeat protein [Candidatus Competibacteraceae bacterium]